MSTRMLKWNDEIKFSPGSCGRNFTSAPERKRLSRADLQRIVMWRRRYLPLPTKKIAISIAPSVNTTLKKNHCRNVDRLPPRRPKLRRISVPRMKKGYAPKDVRNMARVKATGTERENASTKVNRKIALTPPEYAPNPHPLQAPSFVTLATYHSTQPHND